MPLSTSSSRQATVVGGAILIALGLMLAYHLAVVNGAIPPGMPARSQENSADLEEYIYLKESPNVVATGSSILDNVMKAKPQTAIHNLCLRATWAIEGVLAIGESGKAPKLVLVEVNHTVLKKIQYLAKRLHDQKPMWLIRFSPIFLEKFKPGAVLRAAFYTQQRETLPPGSRAGASPDNSRRASLAAKASARRVALANRPFKDQKKLENSLNVLKESLDVLEKRGTKIAFVIVPQATDMMASVTEQSVVAGFKAKFPPDRYLWIESSTPGRNWQAPDGHHLTSEECEVFKEQLIQALKDAGVSETNSPAATYR